MKKYSFVLIAIIIFSLQTSAQTGQYVPQLAAFDAAMNNLLAIYNVPGAQLAITRNGRLVYNRGFGFANVAANDSVQPYHVFRLASISKTITGISIMKLYEQGLINLDDKVFGVNGILNDAIYQSYIDPRVANITVRNLLQHSGGWDRAISGDPMFNSYQIATLMGVTPPASESVVVRYILNNKMLDFTPNTQYQYSNFGFCILGLVIEKITGLSYDTYVKTNILNPAGISTMELGSNLVANALPNEVSYYDYPSAPLTLSVYNNTQFVPWPYGGFNLEAMDAHGGWVSNAEDLCKLMVAVDKIAARPDVLTSASIDTLTKPSINYANYACGISVNSNNNWWHMGSLPGTTTEIVMNRNQQLNWAILCNTRDNANALTTAVDNLVWNNLSAISSWPSFDLFTSINDLSNPNSFKLYPNPADEFATISLQGISTKNIELAVIDLLGKVVFETRIDQGVSVYKLQTSGLLNGPYIIQLKSEGAVFAQKLNVQH